MGAIYSHGGHLDSQTTTICTYFQSPFNTRLHIKFEDVWPRGFREEVVQRCGRTDGQTDDGRRVINIAHPEPLAQVSSKDIYVLCRSWYSLEIQVGPY